MAKFILQHLYRGAINARCPQPISTREFSKAGEKIKSALLDQVDEEENKEKKKGEVALHENDEKGVTDTDKEKKKKEVELASHSQDDNQKGTKGKQKSRLVPFQIVYSDEEDSDVDWDTYVKDGYSTEEDIHVDWDTFVEDGYHTDRDKYDVTYWPEDPHTFLCGETDEDDAVEDGLAYLDSDDASESSDDSDKDDKKNI